MKLRDHLGPEVTARMRAAVELALDSEGPAAVVILDQEHSKVSDCYWGMCDFCVDALLHQTVHHAVAHGSLPEKAYAMLMGHKHENADGSPFISNPKE